MLKWLKQSIVHERDNIEKTLAPCLQKLSRKCVRNWFNSERLDTVLFKEFATIPYASLIYGIKLNGKQCSSNISDEYIDHSMIGQDLSDRPYLAQISDIKHLMLSDVYLSQTTSRSCITALQVVTVKKEVFGLIAVDLDLMRLPRHSTDFSDAEQWRQIRGDPAIRGSMFLQIHELSTLDHSIENVVPIIEELICERGIFHVKIHYSSSRTTLWQLENPYHYRVHVLDEILNPAVCLAYPPVKYTNNALVTKQQVKEVLDKFTQLRFADETVYLRSASINIINGMVGLTFSCDGTHYLTAEKFMSEKLNFGVVKSVSNVCQ